MIMNTENIKFAIELMQEAEHRHTLSMWNYQSDATSANRCPADIASTLDELHTCGNRACFIGHLALTEQWRAFWLKDNVPEYIRFDYNGDLFIRNPEVPSGCDNFVSNDKALSHFFGIPIQLCNYLIFGGASSSEQRYPVPFEDVEPKHVIAMLQHILSGELK